MLLSGWLRSEPPVDGPIFSYLLVKLAARCNLDCGYCYWFRDAAVYDKPKLMSAEVLHQLLQRIQEHVAKHPLADFPIILHGGEPLLWGVDNFHRMAEACDAISSRTGCDSNSAWYQGTLTPKQERCPARS